MDHPAECEWLDRTIEQVNRATAAEGRVKQLEREAVAHRHAKQHRLETLKRLNAENAALTRLLEEERAAHMETLNIIAALFERTENVHVLKARKQTA